MRRTQTSDVLILFTAARGLETGRRSERESWLAGGGGGHAAHGVAAGAPCAIKPMRTCAVARARPWGRPPPPTTGQEGVAGAAAGAQRPRPLPDATLLKCTPGSRAGLASDATLLKKQC